MHGEHGGPFLLAHVEDHAITQDPRDVHQDVDAPPRLDHLIHHRGRLRVVGHGAEIGGRGTAQLLDLLDDLGGRACAHALSVEPRAEVVDDDLGPGRRQRHRDPPTDAPAGSRYQCGPSVEQCHDRSCSQT